MIAKKVMKKKGSKSDFKNLVSYLMRDHKADEHIEYSRISNCGFDTMSLATKEILATQSRNTRSKANKTCHLVVSFQAGEHPTHEQLIDIEDEIAKSVGYSDHQRISVLHTDTDNVHLHIAINKIHPTNHKSVELLRDHYRLSEACELLEKRHGLQQDNRAQNRDRSKTITGRAGDLESHSGVDSFQRWIHERKPALNEVLNASSNWDELHEGLALFDVTLRERGAGLVISAKSVKAFTKASALGRDFSKGKLESRFGSFVPSNAKEVKPQDKYCKRPKKASQDTSNLWAQYQHYKKQITDHKRHVIKTLNIERATQFTVYKQQRDAKRHAIFGDTLLSTRQKRQVYRDVIQHFRAESTKLRLYFKQQKSQIHQQHPVLSWQAWLIQQATDGCDEALKTLRSVIQKPIKGAEKMAFLGEGHIDLNIFDIKPVIRANGDAVYVIKDSTIRDTGDQLRINIEQRDDLVTAITLARKKYGDHLKIDGDDAFKTAVVEVCVQTNQKVTFEDIQLERQRQILQEVKEAHQHKTILSSWIKQENKTNEKNNDIMCIRHFEFNDKGKAKYIGIRHLNQGFSVALYHKKNEVLVVPISRQELPKFKQYQIGTQVILNEKGHAQAQSQGHGR